MVYDIKVKILEHRPFDGSTSGRLVTQLSGKDVNLKIVNAIRRIACNYVPSYAYPPERITITKNTTVAYNNDMMRLRLSMLPVFGEDPKLDYLPEKYWMDIEYNDPNRNIHPTEKRIDAYINATNKTDKIMNVTTHDIILKIDGKDSDLYKKVDPILIIKLRPNDTFNCLMKAALGVGARHTIWSAAQNGYHEEDGNGFKLTLETAGKMDLKDIFMRAISFIINKITDIYKEIYKSYDGLLQKIEFEIDNEDISLADIINYEFQSNQNITYSGTSRPDTLINLSVIKVVADKDLIKYIKESFDSLLDKLKVIKL